jgi:hypothetical protein
MRLKAIATIAATAALLAPLAAQSAAATDPPDNGNCFSSFVNGGSLGGQVSGNPGGKQVDGTALGGLLHETHGQC